MTSDRPGLRAAAILLAWVAFLITTIVGLRALGSALAPPPMTDSGALNGWFQARPPAEAAFALLRLVALGTAWYLLLATVASTLARLSRVRAAIRASDMLAVPAVRRLVNAAAGVSVAATTLTTGTAMASPGTAPLECPAMEAAVQTDQPPTGALGEETENGSPTGASKPSNHHLDEEMQELPTLRRLPDNAAEPPPPMGTTPKPGPPVASTPARSTSSTASSPMAAAVDPQPIQWQVQFGQHFWAVAENVLASAWQRSVSDAEIDPYWRHLVETNRSILRDPGNPDLLYPGQVLNVPPPPPRPSPAKPQDR